MVPIKGRASSLLEIILYAQIRGLKYQKQNRMEEETELHGLNNLPKVKIFSTLQVHHLILAFIIPNQIIFVYIHKYIHALYNIMNCSKK